MAYPTVSISIDQLSKMVAEHKAAEAFLNVYFNPSISVEEKYDLAVSLDKATKAVTATVRHG